MHKLQSVTAEEAFEVNTANYLDNGICIKAYFYNDQTAKGKFKDIKKAIQSLDQYGIPLDILYFQQHIINEKDWENEWKKYFSIERITDRITVVPEWETHETKKNELSIKIDPGMAFGTGTHPTTKLSIKALEKYVQKDDIIADVGVGSGVLSIAACLLGAKHVYGFDIDPVAIKSAQMNIALNNFTDKTTLREHDLLKHVHIKANMIVSNILAEILIDLVDDAWNCLLEDGLFITSGIIDHKQQLIESKLLQAGFSIIEVQKEGHWTSITAPEKESLICNDISLKKNQQMILSFLLMTWMMFIIFAM